MCTHTFYSFTAIGEENKASGLLNKNVWGGIKTKPVYYGSEYVGLG